MADAKDFVAGSSSLVLGCDSYTSPAELGEQELVMGQNLVVRGGIAQTRPGSRSLFCLPEGNFQGATLFTPDNGTAQIVAAVDGKIYVSAAPFTSYRRLWNLQFSITSKYVAWCVTLKSTDYDVQGNLYSLDVPYSVLIMQDGATRAAFWDGGTSGHINPAPAPGGVDTAVEGYQGTPIGLWMIWAGNHLWVSRGNQVFASDIGNPLKFTEAQYLNEARAFYLSGPCTGFIATSDRQGIIAFTERDGTFFQSSIQQRTEWLNTPDFQKMILPETGCVAPRSLVTQYGLNWWFGPRGLTNINSAMQQNLSSRIDYQDNEMFSSKAYLGPDLSGICGGYYENYLMMSVPSCDVLNRHTWILDQAPFEGNVNSWTGFWSGWRPVEWMRGLVNGSERVFFGSVDYDGKNRIWEAFLADKTDNGCAITCYAQLRDHAAGNLDQKRYDWTKFFLSQMYGEIDLNIYVASTKGGYQLQKGYHLVASKGQIFSDVQYSEAGPLMIGNRVQSRTIRTPSGSEDDACNACGVESTEGNKVDYAFSHLLVWSGQMGIRAYQMHMLESPERNAGDCEEDEVAPRTLNAAGCSGLELLVDGQVFETFTGYAEGMAVTSYGTDIYIRRTATSSISQINADVMAACAVQQIIAQLKDTDIAPGVYDSTAAEIGNGTYVVINSPRAGQERVALSFVSESGTAELRGWSEYSSPSVPPKKYLVATSSGQSNYCVYPDAVCPLGLGPTGAATSVVGQYDQEFGQPPNTFDPVTNTPTYSTYRAWDTVTGIDCLPITYGYGPYVDYADGVTPYQGIPYQVTASGVITRTPTVFRQAYNGLCRQDGPFRVANHGELLQTLSVEDTEDDAIARATIVTGTSDLAFKQVRGAGDFEFSFADVTMEFTCYRLINGIHYNVTVDVLEENYGGGSPVLSQRSYGFTASGDTHTINDTLIPASGKQLTASNPQITS